MKSFSLFYWMLFIFCISCSFKNDNNDNAQNQTKEEDISYTVSLKLITSDLEGPVGMAAPNDGTGRLFVIEQRGHIRVIKNGQLLATPFLDISPKLDGLNSFY